MADINILIMMHDFLQRRRGFLHINIRVHDSG